MGTSSNKEQKIEVHVNINMDKPGGKSQKYIASVNSNNPSAIINLSGINSEINETTETSQINPTNQSVINTQNNGNIQNVLNSQNSENYQNNGNSENNLNNGNNQNNDAPAPPSLKSSIKSSIKQSNNINEGGTGCKKPNENDNKPTKGNININEGGTRRVEDNGPETVGKPTKGNININEGGKRRVGENEPETVGKPTKGNININEGGKRRVGQEYKTPKETPYSKPINTVNSCYLSKNDLNNNDSDDPLGFSKTVYVTDIDLDKINEQKDLINKLVEEGYFPLFMQLDKEKPLFLSMKNYVTLQNVVEEYKNLIGYNNNNKKYTLYNKQTKSIIPQDESIKDLKLKYFTFISNNV
jgi:hypothetical protein